nr:protoporphyrinogen oxidase [Planctomycetales bacterium]
MLIFILRGGSSAAQHGLKLSGQVGQGGEWRMTNLRKNRVSIVVIGGGISGLAASWRVRELAPEARLLLLEASDRWGGVLQTIKQDGFLIERSADSFITDQPWGLDFCRRIGVEDQLIKTRPTDRRAYVVRKGRLVPVPDGFQIMAPARLRSVLASPVLSWWGRLRLCCEPLIRARGAEQDEESLAEFATRRLGREAYQRLVQPLVAGIYAADPHQLSVAATMPRFIEMERQYGSLFRGLRARQLNSRRDRQDSGARYSMFVSLRDGMGSLVDAIAARLPPHSLRLNTAVRQVGRDGSGWQLTVDGQAEPIRCDRLIVATSARVASGLLQDCDHELATDLAGIPHGSIAVVCLAYRHAQLRHPLQGFGFVVPAIENRPLLAASYSSEK